METDAGPLVLVLVAAIAAAIGIAWYRAKQREARRAAWRRTAASLDMTYAAADPFGLRGMPFALFGKGKGRTAENVCHGQPEGRDAWLFDYEYYVEGSSNDGGSNRRYERFTCAILGLPLDCPRTRLERESFMSRVADVVGFRDIEFESEEFNRAFQVTSDDKRFASYLIDARMMTWLLAGDRRWAYEVSGPFVLVWAGREDPERARAVLDRARGFVEAIPRVVLDTFGGRS